MKISNSVSEKLGYYVYLLKDPRNKKPFYIGKGHGNRVIQHGLSALDSKTKETDKIKKIREINSAGKKVVVEILRHSMSEDQAFAVECSIIDYIGINNLTNIVSGHGSGDTGSMSLEELQIKYEAKEAIFSDSVVLININSTFERGMSLESLYEATRKHWHVSFDKVIRINIACGVYRGVIRCVYQDVKWIKSPLPEKGRCYFEGLIADEEILNKYLHKSVVKYWEKKGSVNPIRYVEYI
jgi:hypothetical protein